MAASALIPEEVKADSDPYEELIALLETACDDDEAAEAEALLRRAGFDPSDAACRVFSRAIDMLCQE